jgi:hypothetical protein
VKRELVAHELSVMVFARVLVILYQRLHTINKALNNRCISLISFVQQQHRHNY